MGSDFVAGKKLTFIGPRLCYILLILFNPNYHLCQEDMVILRMRKLKFRRVRKPTEIKVIHTTQKLLLKFRREAAAVKRKYLDES